MAGFVDFLNTPQGMGLLSGIASYAVNARRGTPVNNIGRGVAGGLLGYQQATESQKAEMEKAAKIKALRDAMNAGNIQEQPPVEAQYGLGGYRGAAPDISMVMSQNKDINDLNELPDMSGMAQTMPFSRPKPLAQPLNQPSYEQMMPKVGVTAPPMLPEQAVMTRGSQPSTQAGFDPRKAAMAMVNSDDEKLMLAGYKVLSEAPKGEDSPWGKIDPSKYSPESVRAFAQTRDYGALIPLEKSAEQDRLLQMMTAAGVDPSSDEGKGILRNWLAKQTSHAPAPSASASIGKVELKTGESLAGQVGPMLKDSRTRAVGALKMADSADRLDKALESGKVIAGPFASKRMFLNQLGSSMGITGPDSVTQTRQVIRSLAESSVEARKELQGQGQVTENEAKAVEKAMSGNIDEFTVDELKSLVSLNKKAAKFSAQQHQFLLDQARSDEATKGVARFYEVPGMQRLLEKDGEFSDAEKERRYQEWKKGQGK